MKLSTSSTAELSATRPVRQLPTASRITRTSALSWVWVLAQTSTAPRHSHIRYISLHVIVLCNTKFCNLPTPMKLHYMILFAESSSRWTDLRTPNFTTLLLQPAVSESGVRVQTIDHHLTSPQEYSGLIIIVHLLFCACSKVYAYNFSITVLSHFLSSASHSCYSCMHVFVICLNLFVSSTFLQVVLVTSPCNTFSACHE